MNNERFAIPELLFHPTDVGIHEMGVAEALVYAVESLPEGEWLLFIAKSAIFHLYHGEDMLHWQASKWDFNFGGQLVTNSKNLRAKFKF